MKTLTYDKPKIAQLRIDLSPNQLKVYNTHLDRSIILARYLEIKKAFLSPDDDFATLVIDIIGEEGDNNFIACNFMSEIETKELITIPEIFFETFGLNLVIDTNKGYEHLLILSSHFRQDLIAQCHELYNTKPHNSFNEFLYNAKLKESFDFDFYIEIIPSHKIK